MEKYFCLVCIIILYIGIHAALNYGAQMDAHNYYEQRIKDNKTTPKVYDIMHKHLPHLKDIEWVDNLILGISILPMIYANDPDLYFDFASLLIIVNIIRDITINLTILPKDKECSIDSRSSIYQTLVGGCYDKIFSGHFAFVFILSLLYSSYNVVTNVPLLIIWNVINAIVILLIRSHYTIDIVVSFFVCLAVFNEYMKNHVTLEQFVIYLE
jgi:hypothetical protein